MTTIITTPALQARLDKVKEWMDLPDDEAFIRRALSVLEGQQYGNLKSAAASALRSTTSPKIKAAAKANGSAPVKEGSKPRGRPRKEAK